MESRNRPEGSASVSPKRACRTCKIRKVKCDQQHPVCLRCSSTGRICDGYGIWGGGGNLYGHRQTQERHVLPRPPKATSLLSSGTKAENGYFEWFKCRTATKLPGSFMSSFWSTLLFQTSLKEPAVYHAILALSSVHKSGIINPPKEHRYFTLEHYGKAIRNLQPHFSTTGRDRTSFRVALITCAVFVYLELLRGHFETAQTHLRNGIKILRDMPVCSDEQQEGFLHFKPSREPIDDSIVEAFSRLHLQVELFRISYHHPRLIILDAELEDYPPLKFTSTNEAWLHMERLLNKLFYFTHQARQQAAFQLGTYRPSPLLLDYQRRIRMDLARWLSLYQTFRHSTEDYASNQKTKDFLKGHTLAEKERGYQLIAAYHTMATIMADTCLQPNEELIFDLHTDKFILLMEQLIHLKSQVDPETFPAQSQPGLPSAMSRSIIDVGPIPLLNYAATKCRIHQIRLQAIKMLEHTRHREGIWGAKIAAAVARKVMEVEERDFYTDFRATDDFPLTGLFTAYDLSLPTLPDSHRMREVEIILSGNPTDKILLFCKRQQGEVYVRALVSQYDMGKQRWEDAEFLC